MDPSYEPEPRSQHCSAPVQDKWYNYGGITSDGGTTNDGKRCSPDVIEEFDPAHQVWKKHPTHGDTPPGYIGSAAASIGSKFYHFGGSCGGEMHNTISELDVSTFQWKKLEPTNEDGICPIPKMDAGMIAFDNRVLVIYGGKGVTPDGEATWTNQLHCFDIETRKWYIPTMSGERNLTPCEGCTFTKVDYYRAVLFGGHKSENCLRILDMTDKNNWIWSVEKSSSDRLWPDLRGYHLAISLRKIGSKEEESLDDPQLMILFGMDQNSENMMDSWVYNFRKKRWTLGAFPKKLVQRSAACVKNSTCLLYTPKSPSTEGKTLFQFGGVKCTPSSPMRSVNDECKADSFLYSTNMLEMDIGNDSLVVTSAKRLETAWLSVNRDYPELTHFEEERKQTFHLSPGKEQHMDLSDIGISLRIHGSDSEGDSEISVLPAVGGPFAMPEGYKPKSPIYMMNESNKKLKKKITVTMGHYANLKSEKDCKKMTFLKGCADPVEEGSRLIYKFEVITEGNGKFAKGDRQGEITLQEAVPLCIANKQSKSRKKSLTTAYFLKLYSTPSPCNNYCAILAVSLYQDLYVKLLSSFMRKKYPALTESTFKSSIHFDEDQIKIKWDTGKAWTVISDIDPPMIRQEEVDLPNSIEGHGITFEDGEIYPPRIKLTFTPEEPHVPSSCNITVHGLTKEISFNLHLSMNSKHPETPKSPHHDSLHEDQVKEVEPGHRETYLRELLSLLDPAAFKWESIGIALDFSTGDLHNIKHNHTLAPEGPRAFLRVLIQQWLGWTPPDHNLPTLESLYNALETPNVDEQVLAEKLRQKIVTEKLMQRNPDIKTRVNDSIGKLVTTTLQWKGNEMITKTREVVSWMNEIMKNLKEPSDLFSKAGKIKFHCEAISQLSQDVLQEAEAQSVNGAEDLKECKESVITASQLLHKQAHLQLTNSQGERMEEKWVPTMESVINQMISLADALKKLLEQTDLVVRETPKSTKSNQWTTLTRRDSKAGFVKAMTEKMKDQIPVFGAARYSVSTNNHHTDPTSPDISP